MGKEERRHFVNLCEALPAMGPDVKDTWYNRIWMWAAPCRCRGDSGLTWQSMQLVEEVML